MYLNFEKRGDQGSKGQGWSWSDLICFYHLKFFSCQKIHEHSNFFASNKPETSFKLRTREKTIKYIILTFLSRIKSRLNHVWITIEFLLNHFWIITFESLCNYVWITLESLWISFESLYNHVWITLRVKSEPQQQKYFNGRDASLLVVKKWNLGNFAC